VTQHAEMGAEWRGREAVERFDAVLAEARSRGCAVLAEARSRGCAVLATFDSGKFSGWVLIPWK